MRPIDADKLEYKEVIEPMRDRDGMIYPLHYLVVKKTDIMCAPTLDVAPVKHGEWIWMGEQGDSRHMCSVCKGKEKVPTIMGEPIVWEYCPNCGAKMDGERR